MNAVHARNVCLAFIGAIAMTACSEKPNPDASAVVVPPEPAVAASGAVIPPSPTAPDAATKSFLEEMALWNMYEIQAAHAAQARSTSGPVQDFAKKAVDDFTAYSKDLEPVATSAGIMPPTALDAGHMAKLDALTKATPETFDKIFLDQQEAELTAAQERDKSYAETGSNDTIKSYAQKRTAKVAAHLAAVKALKAAIK